MTAKRTKAPYGSAPKKTCKKCDRKISCTNISKHIKWQNAQNYTAVRESFKLLPQYKEDMEEASTRTVYEERVRIEKYRLYLQTKFKQRFNN
ncbi:hypothetical protein AM587_10001105 [Phytophthora nicotianae]|uniref:Uncharacterized protein n=1 Tax=Phytophthora nicotianae TaxID=4792 RepID=A0A0W8CHQ4_PHYNI|nr:hypothetical protein AM587_10001105 [Phytophthora nicotianae]